MTQVYFHCSNAKGILVDRCGATVDDLAEARDRAACVVRRRAASKIGAAGSWMSTTTSATSSSLSPSLSRSASHIEVAMFAVQSPIRLLCRCVVGINRMCNELMASAIDPYQPERHYMRGPGPKWLAKHGAIRSGMV
jgi:hypothetical protein